MAILIPNGGPSTMMPSSPETPLFNGVPNGHIMQVQDSPFIGYIIAMHRKMVRVHATAIIKCSVSFKKMIQSLFEKGLFFVTSVN